MSITVKCWTNEDTAEVKKICKEAKLGKVLDYIQLLEDSNKGWQELSNSALTKLIAISKEKANDVS